MKINLKYLLTVLLMFSILPVFAAVTQVVDITDPSQLVLLLMPAISWLATEAYKAIVKLLGASTAGGWLLGLIVPGLSAIGAYLLTLFVPDASFIIAFALGFGSTFIDNLIGYFNNSEKKK